MERPPVLAGAVEILEEVVERVVEGMTCEVGIARVIVEVVGGMVTEGVEGGSVEIVEWDRELDTGADVDTAGLLTVLAETDGFTTVLVVVTRSGAVVVGLGAVGIFFPWRANKFPR